MEIGTNPDPEFNMVTCLHMCAGGVETARKRVVTGSVGPQGSGLSLVQTLAVGLLAELTAGGGPGYFTPVEPGPGAPPTQAGQSPQSCGARNQ